MDLIFTLRSLHTELWDAPRAGPRPLSANVKTDHILTQSANLSCWTPTGFEPQHSNFLVPERLILMATCPDRMTPFYTLFLYVFE